MRGITCLVRLRDFAVLALQAECFNCEAEYHLTDSASVKKLTNVRGITTEYLTFPLFNYLSRLL
jgi:hypothetical protein